MLSKIHVVSYGQHLKNCIEFGLKFIEEAAKNNSVLDKNQRWIENGFVIPGKYWYLKNKQTKKPILIQKKNCYLKIFHEIEIEKHF